jgi:hypothetical protein
LNCDKLIPEVLRLPALPEFSKAPVEDGTKFRPFRSCLELSGFYEVGLPLALVLRLG